MHDRRGKVPRWDLREGEPRSDGRIINNPRATGSEAGYFNSRSIRGIRDPWWFWFNPDEWIEYCGGVAGEPVAGYGTKAPMAVRRNGRAGHDEGEGGCGAGDTIHTTGREACGAGRTRDEGEPHPIVLRNVEGTK